MPSPTTLRLATRADLAAINEIYNYYVLNWTSTYQTEPATIAERSVWFDAHGPQHPVTVAEQDKKVVAWGSLSRFHPRAAYSRTVENSVYVHHGHLRKGLGAAVLADLIVRARALQHHVVIAGISADQTPSIELHRRYGFVQCGLLKEVGFKFERWLDVVYMQLML